jgi:hypothetical protein
MGDLHCVHDCRRWRAHREEDRSILEFKDWISGALQVFAVDDAVDVDVDSLLLCTKLAQKAMRYTKMKAFGNHSKVMDDTTNRMQTFDSGIASVFHVPTKDE